MIEKDRVAYFADLTPYEYFAEYEPLTPRPLNVGWLSSRMPFTKRTTDAEFRRKLLAFCGDQYAVLPAQGFQQCELCGLDWGDWYEQRHDQYGAGHRLASIGNGEIRVQGASAVYAAPMLIYHYVLEHDYKPPVEFIEAILAGDPESKEQAELLGKYPDFR